MLIEKGVMRAVKGTVTAGREYNNMDHISRGRNEGITTFWAQNIKRKNAMKCRRFTANLFLKSHKIK